MSQSLERPTVLMSLLALLLLLLLSPVAVAAAEAVEASPESEEQRVVRIHRIQHDCDQSDEECEEQRKVHKIVISADGEIEEHEIEGLHQGGGHVRISGDDGEHSVVVRGLGNSHYSWVGGHGSSGHAGGFLGVELTALTEALRSHFGVPSDAGVMVSAARSVGYAG